ncbi:phosphatase PAP2 family protein [Fictibacillus enclensis]|uniref:phosphatase PAP2 family protein n=1 Tax=Fictibacillus enclensis TaxID=1017270 RepID=UPI0024BFB57B|nr:phosphatase PAP2 family protein [Fictibacillus enclensis]WHY74823.1 phosphatase PAP2 family protein [Fictibacillus enclensis]
MQKSYMKNLSTVIIMGILALKLMNRLRNQKFWMKLDQIASLGLFSARGGRMMDFFLRSYSLLGSGFFLIPITFYLAYKNYQKGKRIIAFLMIANLIGCRWINSSWRKKGKYRRPPSTKPFYIKYGYPSAHAMNSTALYGFFLLLSKKSGKMKFYLLALHLGCICWSRIYLGIHYITDVLTGVAGGTIWLTSIALVFYSDKFQKCMRK